MYISITFIIRTIAFVMLLLSPALCFLTAFDESAINVIIGGVLLLAIAQVIANQERTEANIERLNTNLIKVGKLLSKEENKTAGQ